METLYFDILQFLYHLALALIVGGAFVLGSAVAPAIFTAARTPGEGGLLFGSILARFDQLAILSVVLLTVTSVLKLLAFEDIAIGPRLVARWVALVALAIAVLYGSAWSSPVARTLREQTKNFDELPDGHPIRVEFGRLHRSSTRAMRVALLAGVVALFLS
ncbi:MAG: DUF4149 domain-containing protein [Chloroflexota bacterium]